MKITATQLRQIIQEELEKELVTEQEILDEGLFDTLAKTVGMVLLSAGVASAAPVKVKVLDIQKDKVVTLNMDDRDMDHHEMKMTLDGSLASKFGPGRFVVQDIVPGGDASDIEKVEKKTDGGEVKADKGGEKKASDVEVVDKDKKIVKVKVKKSKLGMGGESSTAMAKAVEFFNSKVTKSADGKTSRTLSSGSGKILGSEQQGDQIIFTVQVK